MNGPTPTPAPLSVPRAWSQAVVITPLHCRKCGYDLRTLRAESKCPECGLEVWQTVLHTVDPQASRLPHLRNPRAVGDAMLVLTGCMLIGTLLLVARPLAVALDSWDQRGLAHWSAYVPRNLLWGASLLLLAGAWAVWRLAPPRGRESSGAVWLDLWFIGIGFFGWILSATMLGYAMERGYPPSATLLIHAATAVTAVVGLLGLRGVLGVIGRRSREYRRSRGGRQGVEAMMAAIAGTLFGAAVSHLAVVRVIPIEWKSYGSVIVWCSTLMIVIGLVYMVVNAWWIRRALRMPPPPMDEVLLPTMPDDTWIPDREE